MHIGRIRILRNPESQVRDDPLRSFDLTAESLNGSILEFYWVLRTFDKSALPYL